MAKNAIQLVPDYVYTPQDGVSTPIYEGIDGVTHEMILILKEMDHKEDLLERYSREAESAAIEYQKGLEDACDPIDGIADMTYEPETVLFKEDKPLSKKDVLSSLLPRLTPDQVALYHYICAGLEPAEIAPLFKTSANAICQRKRKLIETFKRLLLKEDGNV